MVAGVNMHAYYTSVYAGATRSTLHACSLLRIDVAPVTQSPGFRMRLSCTDNDAQSNRPVLFGMRFDDTLNESTKRLHAFAETTFYINLCSTNT